MRFLPGSPRRCHSPERNRTRHPEENDDRHSGSARPGCQGY
jgi:hypothetical protein